MCLRASRYAAPRCRARRGRSLGAWAEKIGQTLAESADAHRIADVEMCIRDRAHSRIVQVAAQDPAFERDSVFTATLLGLAEQYPLSLIHI